jgi:16S rRNA (cytosine967-C5)-methyltransferase
MQPKALLDLATDLLREVLKLDQPADAVVSNFMRSNRALGPRERHALAEMVFTVLRQRLLFQHLAETGYGAPARRLALLAWPATDNSVALALTDAESRWLAASRLVDRASLPDKLRHNLPDWLAGSLQQSLGNDEKGEFWPLVQALSDSAPLDLRVNALKAKREDVLAALTAAGFKVALTPHSPLGLRVQGKPALHTQDVFVRGDVEVQDEGSQLLALLTDPKRGEMVVDFCAGAGGKTLALGAAMRNTGRLYAFDTSGHRLEALKPRMARSGLSNIHPAQIAHERDDRVKRLAGKIDRVLVDAPCSGLGTLRRNPDLKWRMSPAALDALAAQQALILTSAARLLKSGGRLVYATCSLLPIENEAVADAFTATNAQQFDVLPALTALQTAKVVGAEALVAGPYLRLWPHRHQTDGFFAAVWQKR